MHQLLYRQAANTLSLKKCMNISPFNVWALISRSSMQELTISPIFFEPLWLKQLLGKPGCWTLESLQLLNWAIHWLKIDIDDTLAPKTNLALLYFSSIQCRVHAIHIQYCWYPRYWIFGHLILSNCHFYICSQFALKIHRVIENMLEKCCVQFCGIFACSFEIMPH